MIVINLDQMPELLLCLPVRFGSASSRSNRLQRVVWIMSEPTLPLIHDNSSSKKLLNPQNQKQPGLLASLCIQTVYSPHVLMDVAVLEETSKKLSTDYFIASFPLLIFFRFIFGELANS